MMILIHVFCSPRLKNKKNYNFFCQYGSMVAMKKRFALVLSGLCMLGFVSTVSMPLGQAKEVPSVMYQFLVELVGLSDVLYDEEAFGDAQHQKHVEQSLARLKDLSKGLKHHKRLMTPGYEVSADYFTDQIQEAHQAYKDGHHRYAWRQFRSTLHACSHCHAQESTKKHVTWNFADFDLVQDPYNRANFYYTVRGYDQAWTLFADMVSEYRRNSITHKQLDQALNRMLSIALQMNRQPKKMHDFLTGLTSINRFPKSIEQEVALWIEELKRLMQIDAKALLQMPLHEFEAYMDNLYRDVYPFPKLGRDQKVVTAYLAGLVSEYMNSKPKQKTQRMMYWLGSSYLEMDALETSMLGEKYLQHCIVDYPPNMISDICYHALEDHWMMDFSGSKGMDLPADIQETLKMYRERLDIRQPWPYKILSTP
jgi:hypothetical protein